MKGKDEKGEGESDSLAVSASVFGGIRVKMSDRYRLGEWGGVI